MKSTSSKMLTFLSTLLLLSIACSSVTISLNKPTSPAINTEIFQSEGSDITVTQPSPQPTLLAQSTLATNSPPLPTVHIITAAANSNRNLAIDGEGNVWEWGTYETGPANSPCKNPDTDCLLSPSVVTGLTGIVAVSPGYDHNLALRSDGTVWGWGQNETYQLGLGYLDKEYHRTALQVPGLYDVIAISASANFNLALKKDGTVWAWGQNEAGQLGDGKDSYTPDYSLREETPFQVVDLSGVKAIATGTTHSLALRQDGTLWSWGHNQLGELGWGTGDTKQHPIPKQVPDLTDIKTIAAGFVNSVVIKNDGMVWAWGANFGWQLCTGTQDYVPHAPVRLQAFDGALMVASSNLQILALMPDGSVQYCGMLESTIGLTPTIMPGIEGVSFISAGEDHIIALKPDGTLWAWGNNNVGQLGDGTMNQRSTVGMIVFNK